MKYSAFGQKQNKGHITISNGDLYNKAEPPADSEFLSLLRISEFTQNFWVFFCFI